MKMSVAVLTIVLILLTMLYHEDHNYEHDQYCADDSDDQDGGADD